MPPNAAVFCCLKVRFSARSLLHVNHIRTLVVSRPTTVATTSTAAVPPETQKPTAAIVGDTAPSTGGVASDADDDASDADRAGRSCAAAAFPTLRRELAAASAGWRPDAVTLGLPELSDGRAPDGLSSRASSVGRARSLEITIHACCAGDTARAVMCICRREAAKYTLGTGSELPEEHRDPTD
eukprot:scaffold116057_cov63-Phaeocystis_antarctica.AAC.5